MPTSWPAVEDVLAGTTKPVNLAYELVKLTPQVVKILSVNAPSFPRRFPIGENRLKFALVWVMLSPSQFLKQQPAALYL
jgi:hypothetical protein